MCSGHSSTPHYETVEAPKVAPTPTPVQSADVDAEKEAGKKKEKKRQNTTLRTDTPTILGSVYDKEDKNKLG